MNWQSDLAKRIFIEERFTKNDFETCLYNAVLKTMRYISSNISYSHGKHKQELKNKLKEIRQYYLTLIQ
jgi:hypothetical protein